MSRPKVKAPPAIWTIANGAEVNNLGPTVHSQNSTMRVERHPNIQVVDDLHEIFRLPPADRVIHRRIGGAQ